MQGRGRPWGTWAGSAVCCTNSWSEVQKLQPQAGCACVQGKAQTCELGLRFSTSSREALASAMSSASTADCCARGW